MFRFFATCIALAVGTAAVIIYAGQIGDWVPKVDQKAAQNEGDAPKAAAPAKDAGPEEKPAPAAPSQRFAEGPVRITTSDTTGLALPLVIQDGRVMPLERREVPSERDGKLLLLATPVLDTNEYVPEDKLEKMRVSVLAVEWADGDDKRIEREREYSRRPSLREPFTDPDATGPAAQKRYRLPLAGENLSADTIKIIRLPVKFRRLAEDDEVEAGQLIGIINPAVALEELAIKKAKIDAAIAEVGSSRALKEESIRRFQAMGKSRQRVPGSVSDDDYFAGKVTIDRYVSEEVAKKSAVVQAQQELSGAWTTLDLYFIRAPIAGRIRTIYKQQGEAVKNLDAVLQLQNTRRLRVEAQVEVQDALPLQERVRRAEAMRLEARRLQSTKLAEAEALRKKADEITKVQVEITRPVPPVAILPGHHDTVTCVAVTGEQLPRIVSGGEDGVVRIWERVPGEDRWHDKFRLSHGAPIRAIACTGKGKNLLLTASSRGQVRVFDLSGLNKSTEPTLCGQGDDGARHQGAVLTIAVNADGTQAATAGEDRSIIVWDLPSGKRADVIKNAHNSHITWVGFTPNGKLVSAGRDRALTVWDKNGSRWERDPERFASRSTEVNTLSINPKNNTILFDGDRELIVLSLENKRIIGSLHNPGSTGTFSTMALFSPDGNTILTNGNGPGKLQLWRAPSDHARAAELRQLLWTTGNTTCGAFDPNGEFAVTGTSDHRVLVWKLPRKEEAEKPSDAQLTYVEENLDSGLRKVTVRATITNAPEGANPGSSATIVVPPGVR
ncbi:MAG: HlyD family efflux transporter periplasmic adaptor subunit [Gemmataceae bacterium]